MPHRRCIDQAAQERRGGLGVSCQPAAVERAVTPAVVAIGEGMEGLPQRVLQDDRAEILERTPSELVQVVADHGGNWEPATLRA